MKHFLLKGARLGLLLLLMTAIGCQPANSVTPTTVSVQEPQSPSIEVEIDFGPGDLDLPDMRVGLAGLSSYRSVLTISFDGTENGQALKWSSSYTFAATTAPAVRQLIVESTGVNSEPTMWMAELQGVAYERRGESTCVAGLIDPAISNVEELEPAAQLPSLFGAEEVGSETLNGVQAAHYTFDERALTEAGLNKSTGELWLASAGGYVLRFHLTTTGDASYFGEGIAGALTYDYQLNETNQSLAIELPADCPPGLVNAPMLPDAANIQSLPGLLEYDSATSVPDAVAFYQQQLATLGWQALSDIPEGMSPEEYQQALDAMKALGLSQPGQPTPDPNEAYLVFVQDNQRLSVIITIANGVTHVQITLRRAL